MTKYEELANLIFPEVTETIEDLEKRYPERDLPIGAMVTRFAPSPTGFLHTGSLYAAMISRKFAKQSGGVFFIRLEDTDTKREIAGSGDGLVKQLATFGVTADEGYQGNSPEIGNYGPYKQSERASIYKVVIKYLLANNLAYPCFCSAEELSEMRKVQEAKKDNMGYYGEYAKCSKLSAEDAIGLIKQGKPYVIRFRSKGNSLNKIKVHDEIKGDIEMSENDQHIVIYKSDGLPTYHFAHLCDDHFMRTTHVTRGEEWFPSLPIHIELFNTMGWTAPKFCHLSNIMKLDNGVRRKLSKRKDPEAAVEFYSEQGYPKEGFMKFLYTLVNSNFEEWAIGNPTLDKDEFKFTFEKMSIDGALFDLEKAKYFCKEYLGNLSTKEFVSKSYEYAKEFDKELYDLINRDEEYYSSIISIEREQEKPRKDYEKYKDIFPLIKFMYNDYYDSMVNEFVLPENYKVEDVKKVLDEYSKVFDLTLDEENWFNQMKEVAEKCGYATNRKDYKANPDLYKGQVSDVAAILRGALALRFQTPNLYYIMKILGREEVLRRFNTLTCRL